MAKEKSKGKINKITAPNSLSPAGVIMTSPQGPSPQGPSPQGPSPQGPSPQGMIG